MRRLVTSLTLIVFAGALTAAQSAAPPAFEAASIRRSLLNEGRVGWGYQPGGRFVMHRQTVSVLIRQAYPEATDLLGAPDWVTSDAYDVEAKAAGNPPRDEMRRMLRSLLSDRF